MITIFLQVEYLYYSTTDDPRHDIIEVEDDPMGNISRFLKIEESAMCKVCFMNFWQYNKMRQI